MAELNKVLMIGRLTKDPELRYTPNGAAVADFRLAVNHTYQSKDEKQQEVCFIDVNVWGRSAESAKQYLTKGREVFIEGRIQYRTWEAQDGQKRTSYRIVADRWQFVSSAGRPASGEREAMGNEEQTPMPVDEEVEGGVAAPHRARPEPAAEDELPF